MPRKEEQEQEVFDGVSKFFNLVTGILILIFICMIWAIIPIFIINHMFLYLVIQGVLIARTLYPFLLSRKIRRNKKRNI